MAIDEDFQREANEWMAKQFALPGRPIKGDVHVSPDGELHVIENVYLDGFTYAVGDSNVYVKIKDWRKL